MPIDLLATPPSALLAAARAWFGARKGGGLAAAIHRDAVCCGRFAPEALGASAATAAVWRTNATLSLPTVAAEQHEAAAHGTVRKRLLALADGRTIESVALPMGRGRTSLCLSTQVGCARACTSARRGARAFCAT